MTLQSLLCDLPLIRFSLCTSILIATLCSPVFAQDKATPPSHRGLVCSATLTNIKWLLPAQSERAQATQTTFRHLQDLLTYTLRQPKASPSIQEIFINSPIDSLSTKEASLVANRIAGVLSGDRFQNPEDEVLTVGLTLHGKESAYKYFAQIEETIQNNTREIIARDPGEPSVLFAAYKGWNDQRSAWLWSALFSGLAIQGLYWLNGPAVGFGAGYAYRQYNMLSSHFNRADRAFDRYLKAAHDFLQEDRSEQRLLYRGATYKVLNSTLEQSWNGVISDAALDAEFESKHLGFHNVSGQRTRYVMIDTILESSGPEPKDTSLHVVIRASKRRFKKPKKTESKVEEKKSSWAPGTQPSF